MEIKSGFPFKEAGYRAKKESERETDEIRRSVRLSHEATVLFFLTDFVFLTTPPFSAEPHRQL